MLLRVAALIATMSSLISLSSQAQAQYYRSGPYAPGLYRAPPIFVEDVEDDAPVYVPAPPGTYDEPAATPYPYEPPATEPMRPDRQALPVPAPGTQFPPPANYPWLHERGVAHEGSPGANEADAALATPGRVLAPNDGWQPLRPPAEVNTGIPAATAAPPANVAPQGNTTVAALPPDYQPEQNPPKELPAHLKRQIVDYQTKEPPGTIIVDTPNTYLYYVLGNGKAIRYGIGVGREGFTWSGTERITKMAEWPDWYPPKEMIERQPYLPRFMAGGESNPLGARALYLGKTLYRIHGTNQPSTIGSFVSSGCIRLLNEDIEDLFRRVQIGTRVVVLPASSSAIR